MHKPFASMLMFAGLILLEVSPSPLGARAADGLADIAVARSNATNKVFFAKPPMGGAARKL